MYLRVEMPKSAGIEATLELVRQLDEELREEPSSDGLIGRLAKAHPPSTTTCAPTSEMPRVGRRGWCSRETKTRPMR